MPGTSLDFSTSQSEFDYKQSEEKKSENLTHHMLVCWPTLTQGLWGTALALLTSKSGSSLFSQLSLQLSSPKAYGAWEAVSKQGDKNQRQRPESHYDSSLSRYPLSFPYHCVSFLEWTVPTSMQTLNIFTSHLIPLFTHSLCSGFLHVLNLSNSFPIRRLCTCSPLYDTKNVS